MEVLLVDDPSSHSFPALVDSGAAGNFMDEQVVQGLHIPTVPLSVLIPVLAVDSRSVGKGKIKHKTTPLSVSINNQHMEDLRFLSLRHLLTPLF